LFIRIGIKASDTCGKIVEEKYPQADFSSYPQIITKLFSPSGLASALINRG
jgi:hypothetical protein